MATTFCVGAAIGAIELAAPTLATAHDDPAAAGLLIACLSVGGVLGATVYGGRHWEAPPARRLPMLVAVLTAVLALLVAAHGLVLVGVLLFLAGIPLNPTLTTFSLLVHLHVAGEGAGEAFGWLSTAVAGGTGAASAVAATVAQHQHDARAPFAIAAIAGAVATVVVLAARRTLAA
jgi:MFS family permease